MFSLMLAEKAVIYEPKIRVVGDLRRHDVYAVYTVMLSIMQTYTITVRRKWSVVMR